MTRAIVVGCLDVGYMVNSNDARDHMCKHCKHVMFFFSKPLLEGGISLASPRT